MAEKLPLKADTTNGIIRDFETGDFIGVSVGGTGLTTIPSGAMLFASALNTLAALSIGAAGRILQSNGSVPQWVGNIAGVSGGRTLNGGTTSGDYLMLNSTSGATPGQIYFGNNLAANYSQATGVWDTAFKGAGVRYIQTMANWNGLTVGAAGDGVGIHCLGSDNAASPVSLGRIKVVSETVAAGSVSGSFAIDVSNSGTLRQVYKVDENADTHTWALNNSTLLTLAPTLLTLASGVGLTLTSGALTITSGSATLTSGDLTMNNGVITVKKATAGTASAIEMYNNQGTGAVSDAVQLRAWISDTAGTATIAGNLQWLQTTATVSAQTAAVILSARVAGANTTHMRVNGGAGVNFAYPIGINLATLATTPARNFESLHATNPQARLTQTAGSVYADLQCKSDGNVDIISPTGTQLLFNGSPIGGGGGGGGFSGSGTANFGSTFTHYTTFTITHASLAAGSEVVFQAVSTTRPEEVALMQFSFTVISKGSGSWSVGVYTPIKAKGTYQIDFVGV